MVPAGKLCSVPERQQLGQIKHSVPSQQTGSLELGGPWVALLPAPPIQLGSLLKF